MITREEILGGKKCPSELENNLSELLLKINKVRALYGLPMVVTSGFRSMEDHIRIYKNKGITDKSKIPMKSKHLFAQAVDISDPDKKLQKWIKDHIKEMEEIGLWFESFDATPNWVHFQILPPASGNRFFKP